jgi:flagellar protein FlaG
MDTTLLKPVTTPGIQIPGTTTQQAPLRQAPAKSAAPDFQTTENAKKADARLLEQARKAPTQNELQKAVDQANTAIKSKGSNELRFSIDKDSGVSIVKIVDQKTGETLRQIPSQEMLEIAKSIDQMKGLLIKQTA